MVRIRAFAARVMIIAFSGALAFYSLFVSSLGRLNVNMPGQDSLSLFFSDLASSMGRAGLADMMVRLRAGDFLFAALLFAAACVAGEMCFQGRRRSWLRRRAVKLITPALIVFAVAWVFLRLNNTSLYAWNNYMGGNDGYPLFGTARNIRRDEFVLWTPMALSQEYVGYSSVNTLIGNGTDVMWVSMGGLPAWNAALIFKPLYWGFLILGAERGLSILCVSRLVLLFWVSWKTALLYTRNNRGWSFAAAVILTFSPMVQWFVSQSIAEVLIFGQGMILAMDGLLKSDSNRQRIWYAALNAWLLGCFVLIGYPAWLIPAMYIILAVEICQFTRPSVRNRGAKAACLFTVMIPFLVMLGIAVYKSWDTLQAIRASDYPGSRLITGGLSDSVTITGDVWNPAFKIDLASIFFPLNSVEFSLSNSCDASPFLGFAPAGLLLSVEHQWREKKADPVCVAATSVLAFFWIFTFVEFPAWFCKLTLLSQCSRPVFPIGICEVILLIRARSRGGIRDPRLAVAAAAVSALFNMACIQYFGIVRLGTAQQILLTALYLFLFSMLYLDFRRTGVRLAVFSVCCVLLLAGAFVNPVQEGLDMLDDFELVNALKAIENDPDDVYALEGGYPLSDVPLLAGKHCINTDQAYADMNRWTPIDPDGKYSNVYNRLCHVSVEMVPNNGKTKLHEEGNYIFLKLTPKDMDMLGVNYLITSRPSVEFATLVSYDAADDLYIWKLDRPTYAASAEP